MAGKLNSGHSTMHYKESHFRSVGDIAKGAGEKNTVFSLSQRTNGASSHTCVTVMEESRLTFF